MLPILNEIENTVDNWLFEFGEGCNIGINVERIWITIKSVDEGLVDECFVF